MHSRIEASWAGRGASEDALDGLCIGRTKVATWGTDLAGVFERVSVDASPETLRFWMVARIQPEPSDVTRDDLVLQIFDSQGQCVYERQIPESRITYQQWMDGEYSHIWVEFSKFSVHQPDEFSFQLGTTTHVIKDETLRVELKGTI